MDRESLERLITVLERIATAVEVLADKRVVKGARSSNAKFAPEIQAGIHKLRGRTVTVQDVIDDIGLVTTSMHDRKSIGWAIRGYASKVFKRDGTNFYVIPE